MGMSYRNIISSGVIEELERSFDVTFLCLENSTLKEILLKKNKNVVVFKLGIFQKIVRRVSLPLERIQLYSFFQKHNTNTIKKYIHRDSEQGGLLFRLYYLLADKIGKKYGEYEFLSFHYTYFLPKTAKKEITQSDRLLILSSDDPIDKAVLKYADEKEVPSTLLIHSWDNLPARGFFSSTPNKVLVWNEVMKEQAIKLHGVSSNSIDVIGVPQFYGYKKYEKEISRDLFKSLYGLMNDDYKVICYTCSASRVFPDEPLLIDRLIEEYSSKNVYLIIRLHPTERREEYKSKYFNIDNVVIDIPTGNFAASVNNNVKDDKNDILKFVSLMKYSDLVINLASTTTLDAIIFDTPVICIAFNLDETIDAYSWNRASDWYDSSHYRYIVDSNAIKVAYNLEDLEMYAKNYLVNPSLDSNKRYQLRNNFCNYEYDVKLKMAESIL